MWRSKATSEHINIHPEFFRPNFFSFRFDAEEEKKTKTYVRLLENQHSFSNRLHSLQQLEPHLAAPSDLWSIFLCTVSPQW